jgi:hypothetical protein
MHAKKRRNYSKIVHGASGERERVHLPQERVGAIYDDEVFADLFLFMGQPAEAPWRLALVSAAIGGGPFRSTGGPSAYGQDVSPWA